MTGSQHTNRQTPTDSLNRFCVLDVGSTTTKAILFRRNDEWEFYRRESATTVEMPDEDVTIGVVNALQALEKESGETLLSGGVPCLPCFSTSSAGGGLAVVVAGLIREVTSKSAERVALGAGAIIQDVIALDDGRTPYRKIEMLKKLRPDMLLLAGGFDGGAVFGPVFLAELVDQAALKPKLSRGGKLPVIYAGNSAATEFVRELLAERFLFCNVPNLRPSSARENLEPSRHAIHEVFMEHVMSRAPGYDKYRQWIESAILPTPAAVSKLLARVSKRWKKRLMVIDIGGATTDVFTADNGNVVRTVSANLGMSYSSLNVVRQAGLGAIKELLKPEVDETELLNRIGNKYLRPTRLASTIEDARVECALGAVAIREAVKDHLSVMHGVSLNLSEDELGWGQFRKKQKKSAISIEASLAEYDMVIGSGGRLSHSPRRTAAMILMSALRPARNIELAVDSVFMFPHLGVLSDTNEQLALELFEKFAVVSLGRLIPLSGKGKTGTEAVRVESKLEMSGELKQSVMVGDVAFVDFPAGESCHVRLKSGSLKPDTRRVSVDERTAGLIIDARGRLSDRGTDFCVNDAPSVAPDKRETDSATRIHRGKIQITRELAVSGQVFVKPGEIVQPDTIIARSTRAFARPFFLNVAETLKVSPARMLPYLLKNIGDEISAGEVIAENKDNFLNPRIYRSSVAGTIERILPTGTIIVREKLEYARKLYPAKVAEELDIEPRFLKPFIKCEIGQEVEEGQILAGNLTKRPPKVAKSPVRGKVKDIDFEYGVVIIEPLLEELQILAWMPGRVDRISDKGAAIENTGTVVSGVWGGGEEISGIVSIDNTVAEGVVVQRLTGADDLRQLSESNIRGLVTGSVNLADYEKLRPEFGVIITEGFGNTPMRDEFWDVLAHHNGKPAALDPRTQLRAGVVRPRVILPDL